LFIEPLILRERRLREILLRKYCCRYRPLFLPALLQSCDRKEEERRILRSCTKRSRTTI